MTAWPIRSTLGALGATRERLRHGDMGQAPVAIGLVLIAVVFQSMNAHFLTAENLTNLALQMVSTGTIALGLVLVLLLGEIDLSAGSISGLAAVVTTTLYVRQDWHPLVAVAVAIGVAAAIGALHGLLSALLHMPSFVVTLAGLIGWLGLMLYLLKPDGTLNLPFEHGLAVLSGVWLPAWLSWLLAAGLVVAHLSAALSRRWRRLQAGLEAPSIARVASRAVALAGLLAAAVAVLSADRGVPLPFLIFCALVIGCDLLLRRTVFGRRVYAVGGNAEAARRAGINVTRIRVAVFAVASALAATGGVLAASRLAAVNQSSGGSDILLNAIAAAVIGGTSLFGGRGRAYAALFGILVIQSVANGMLLLNVDSSVRLMVTGAVLAVAVAVDATARRGRPG
ncbi:sugar ABC transporter permease [Nonomuraea sp. NPDC050783]|uniref:sugar ABC transporter permease n=1 Tax=Nonomuraea sp. NPDC050783 TaxID=3154634 RepID=UPI0034666406